MNSNQKAILKAALFMPLLYPIGLAKKLWYKLFPKKDTINPSNNP